MPLRRSRIFVVVLLALVAFSTVFLQAPGLAKAQSSSIPLSREYASEDIQVAYYAGGTLLLCYSWININGTHVMFLALHSNQAYSPSEKTTRPPSSYQSCTVPPLPPRSTGATFQVRTPSPIPTSPTSASE